MVAIKTGVKRSADAAGGSCCVFVRGFDFGTTDEQLEGHMGSVGTIESVKWTTKGSAVVTYTSAEEAASAIASLSGTTIEGNTRFMDVLPDEGGGRAPKHAKGDKGFGKGGKGMWVPASVLSSLSWSGGKSFGKGGKGKSGKPSGRDSDPPGCGRVFVRGFDFGTDDEQFEGHMKTAGPIHAVSWVTKGSALVIYKKQASAVKAVSTLNGTIIAGNERYIDVLLKED